MCEAEQRDSHQYLDTLLYENVNDGNLRAHLIKSGGFCGRHARMLLQFGDGLGTAILYMDQIKAVLKFIETEDN